MEENIYFLSILMKKIPHAKSIAFNNICPKSMDSVGLWTILLRQHHSKTLKELDLKGLLMNEFTLNYLFCNNPATSLQLSGLNLSNTKTKGKYVGVALSSQPLEWLDMSDNGLEDADIPTIVSEINSKGTAPAAASTLTTLILSKNPFTDNAIGDLRTLSGKFPKLTADRFNLGETKMTLQGRRAVLNTLPQ